MKYEALIMKTLFVVCLLVCVLTFGTMLAYHPPMAIAGTSHALLASQARSTS